MPHRLKVTSDFLSSILDNIAEEIIVLDSEFNIVYANRSCLAARNLSLQSVLGKRCHDVFRNRAEPCHLSGDECPSKTAMESGEPSSIVCANPTHDGGLEYFRHNAYPARDRDGKISCVTVTSSNITDQMTLHENLRKKTELFETILFMSPDGIIGNDRKGNIFLFNTGAESIFGYSMDEVIGKLNVRELYPPGLASAVKKSIYSELHGGKGQLHDYETEVVHRDGRRIPIRLAANLLYDQGVEAGTIGFFHDISARKALRELLQESEESYRGIFESAKDAILTVGEDRVVIRANQAAEDALGYEKDGMNGKNVCDMFPAEYMEQWDRIRLSSREGAGLGTNHVELTAVKKSGEKIPVLVSLSENRTRRKTVITLIFRDITERVAFEEELRILSITDTLTKLYNRRHFHSILEKEIVRADRTGVPFSILLLDLDRFKNYNDLYGHMEGDKLLVAVAELIRETFRSMDTAFRFGGEEFVVLLPDTDDAGAMIAAERFRTHLSRISFRPETEGKPVSVTASIGISEYRKGYTLDKIVCHADLAMYAAKNGGRDRTVSYGKLIGES